MSRTHRSRAIAGPETHPVSPKRQHRKLFDLRGQHKMVAILSRGGFRPKDRRQHEGLVQLHREIEAG